jgi:HAD superfamily hydrolase (TIGR01509 family)
VISLETAIEAMRSRAVPLRLVIFDCDGVLVDSEPVANRMVAGAVAALGWPITSAEAERLFLGMTLTDMVPVIERHIGRALPADWRPALMQLLVEALEREAEPVPGALEALRGVSALRVPWRIASNSSHEEMRAKFGRLGIAALVAGRVHSHRDVDRGKPAPDLFLAAAAAEGVAPEACVVIEDSPPGVQAAAAAGMACLGFVPHGDGGALQALGAIPFGSMFDVPALVAAALPRAV